MKKIYQCIAAALLLLTGATGCGSLNTDNLLSAGAKLTQALTISDEQVQAYVNQYITDLDSKSTVLPASNAYTKRLNNLTSGITSVDGIPLNFKVYQTSDINAFACADGSVRVYTGLMDIMTDDELLGVIGHEIGHVANKDTKNAFKNALVNSALRDGLTSTGGVVGALSQSQLGDLGEALLSAKYSRKEETNADTYGYNFLRKMGRNPYAMASSFKKLEAAAGGSGQSSSLMNLFSSHPDTQARIEAIEKRCRKDGITKPANYN